LKKLSHIFILLLSGSLFGQTAQETIIEDKDVELKKLFLRAKKCCSNEELDSALFLSKVLYEEAEKSNSLKYLAKADFVIANVNFSKNNITEALSGYLKALKLAKKINDTDLEATLLNSVGFAYFDQKSYAEAKHFFEEEILIKEKQGDSIKLGSALLNMSSIYRQLGEFEQAASLLQRVRKISFIRKDSSLLANYYNGLASNYFRIFISTNKINAYGNDSRIWDKKFVSPELRDSAEIYWLKALKIWQAKNDKANAIIPLFNLGYVYQTRKDHDKALSNYLLAAVIAEDLKMQSKKITLYGNLAEVYYDIKNYRLAADYFRKGSELKDSLQKAESKKYSEKLGKQYQLETNKTIELQKLSLELKNNEISSQRKQIYFYILLFIVMLLLVTGIIFYVTFNKRLTKKIDEAREKFFNNIMHEIRTPLSMIQAPLKTLKPKLSDEESMYYINLAEKNVVRLNELINQMLDISKMDHADYKLNNSVGNMELFLKEITNAYEKSSTDKNIIFISEINYKNTLLIYDKDALEKILTNLLSNAIKYTQAKGTVGLTVNVEDSEGASKLVIDVWDTGIGIAKNEQAKIFDRFFRSEKSANKAQGIGIGLSLVKELVNAYKGKISFTSEENKGTKFTVELNLKHPEQLEVPAQDLLAESDKPVILLIEDDEDILDFTGNFLGSKDLGIIKAKNGNLAKTLLKNISPNLIVTDLMMDELDGLSFIKEIKANKGLNHIPIIVLSAKSAGQTRVEVLNAGAQAFLSKPFLPEELFSVISNQLELISKIKSELKSKIETQKPDQTAEQKFISTEPYTQKLFDLIFKHLDNSDLTVELLADLMATNRSHFQRKIKNLTGYSPSELIKLIRLEKSKEFLLSKKGNITEVAYMCGFSSQSYFTKCFTQQFGFSPTQIFNQEGAR